VEKAKIQVVEWHFEDIFCSTPTDNTTIFKSIKRRFKRLKVI